VATVCSWVTVDWTVSMSVWKMVPPPVTVTVPETTRVEPPLLTTEVSDSVSITIDGPTTVGLIVMENWVTVTSPLDKVTVDWPTEVVVKKLSVVTEVWSTTEVSVRVSLEVTSVVLTWPELDDTSRVLMSVVIEPPLPLSDEAGPVAYTVTVLPGLLTVTVVAPTNTVAGFAFVWTMVVETSAVAVTVTGPLDPLAPPLR
jgi:hypothetical protein